MAYLRDRSFAAASGCSGGCACAKCGGGSRLGERFVRDDEEEEDAPGTGAFGFGCSGGCGCAKCGGGARLGERFVRDDEDEEDGQGTGALGFAEAAVAQRVVLVPGLMGSRLFDTVENRFVWGDRSMLDYVPLRLGHWFARMNDRSGRVAPRGLTRISLPLVTIDPYGAMLAFLSAQLGPGNVLAFDYDWRQANESSAVALKRRLEARWPDAGSGGANRVTIIAHSMGGLVSRCYIEQLGGSRFVKRLITIGTPHHGAPDALHALLNSGALGRFILPASIVPPATHVLLPVAPFLILLLNTLQKMVGNLPSMYQLLPDGDFLYPGPVAGAPEPIAATYGRLATSPALDPILGTAAAPNALIRDPRAGGMTALRALNRRLSAAIPSLATLGVQYVTVAASNYDTVRASRYIGGTTFVPLSARCGDGTVPIESAILPRGGAVQPVIVSSSIDHGEMLRDSAIQRLCLDLILGRTAPMTLRPVCPPARPRLPIVGRIPSPAEILAQARAAVP